MEEIKDTVETPTTDEPTGDQVEQETESTTVPADATSEKPPKKGGGFQKRIDKLTKTVYELRAQLEERNNVAPPKEDKEPVRDNFEDYESYQRAVAEHTARRVIREQRAEEEKTRKAEESRRAQSDRLERWQNHVSSVSDKHDDAEDILDNFAAEATLSSIGLEAILESDIGGDIAYHLGKNDAELERISKLNPARQAIEIGKLEVKLSSAPKRTSNAPPPIDPVKGSGNTKDLKYRPDMSDEDYSKLRRKLKGR